MEKESFYKKQVLKAKKALEKDGFTVREDGSIEGRTHDFTIKSTQ